MSATFAIAQNALRVLPNGLVSLTLTLWSLGTVVAGPR
jgi:hypothetical protein